MMNLTLHIITVWHTVTCPGSQSMTMHELNSCNLFNIIKSLQKRLFLIYIFKGIKMGKQINKKGINQYHKRYRSIVKGIISTFTKNILIIKLIFSSLI